MSNVTYSCEVTTEGALPVVQPHEVTEIGVYRVIKDGVEVPKRYRITVKFNHRRVAAPVVSVEEVN